MDSYLVVSDLLLPNQASSPRCEAVVGPRLREHGCVRYFLDFADLSALSRYANFCPCSHITCGVLPATIFNLTVILSDGAYFGAMELLKIYIIP